MRAQLIGICLALVLTGCGRAIHPMPRVVTSTDPVRYYDLEVPDGLTIQNVAFDVTTFNGANGDGPAGMGAKAGGRGFLKVYAIHKDSGEQYLLIYEDVGQRKQPGLVIRFQPVDEKQIPLKAPVASPN